MEQHDGGPPDRTVRVNPAAIEARLAAMDRIAARLEQSAQLVAQSIEVAAEGDPHGWLDAGTDRGARAAQDVRRQAALLRALLADAAATLQTLTAAAQAPLLLQLPPLEVSAARARYEQRKEEQLAALDARTRTPAWALPGAAVADFLDLYADPTLLAAAGYLPAVATWAEFRAFFPNLPWGPETSDAAWAALGYSPQQAALLAVCFEWYVQAPLAHPPTSFIGSNAQRFSEHFLQRYLPPADVGQLGARLDAINARARVEGRVTYTADEWAEVQQLWYGLGGQQLAEDSVGQTSQGVILIGGLGRLGRGFRPLRSPFEETGGGFQQQRLPPSIRFNGFREHGHRAYVATWGDDPMAFSTFQELGRGIDVSFIKRGSQPYGTGGLMLADAFRASGITGRPSFIRLSNIINDRTRDELDAGMAIEQTLMGRMVARTIEDLGGRPSGWIFWKTDTHLPKEQQKVFIEVTITYGGR